MSRRPLRSVPVYGWLFAATPPFGLTAGIAAAFEGGERVWWPVSRAWAAGILRTAGIDDIEVRGVEKLEGLGHCVLMSNHQSHLDPPLIIRSSSRPISFLAKIELFRFPGFGWALRRLGHIPVDRRQRESAFASIEKAAEEVAEGRAVLVFPEGTRGTEADLLPFKKGGFVLAIKSGAPIVPIGIGGTRTVYPPGWWVTGRGGRVAMVVGDPIPTDGVTLEDKDALMAEVRERISQLRDEARRIAGFD